MTELSSTELPPEIRSQSFMCAATMTQLGTLRPAHSVNCLSRTAAYAFSDGCNGDMAAKLTPVPYEKTQASEWDMQAFGSSELHMRLMVHL